MPPTRMDLRSMTRCWRRSTADLLTLRQVAWSPSLSTSTNAASLQKLHGWHRMIGGRNNREAQVGGFSVEQGYLLLAVLLFVELLAPVDVFLSEAQHSIEQHREFVGHGRDRFWRPQFAVEAAILRTQIAAATPECESRDAEGCRRPVYYLARSRRSTFPPLTALYGHNPNHDAK